VLFIAVQASARTWYIRADGTGDAPTIQVAVDSARAGDEIVLENGVFRGSGNRDINFHADSVSVRSGVGDPATCIIDCDGMGRGFNWHSTIGVGPYLRSIRIAGLTVRNSSAACSSALYWNYGEVSVDNCVFESNQSAALYLKDAIGHFTNCVFRDNRLVLNTDQCDLYFTDCTIFRNSNIAILWYYTYAYFTRCTVYGNVGRFYVWDSSVGRFTSCTFWENASGRGLFELAVTSEYHGWYLYLTNCIVANSSGPPIYRSSYPSPEEWRISISCTDIYGNRGGDWVGPTASCNGKNGNFSGCPSFCAADLGDFDLCDGSPCLPGNHPTGYNCGLIGAWDAGCSCGPSKTEPSTWGAIKAMFK